MKIIHFITSIDNSGGGTTAYIQLLASELKNLLNLVVVTSYSKNPIELKGVKIQFFNFNLHRWFSLQNEFRIYLKEMKPDIVHINGIWNPQNWLFQKEAQRLGIKVILSPHGMLEPYILNRHPLKKKIALTIFQEKAIRRAEYIHATAQSELDNLHRLGYNQTSAIIPNGIDISEVKQKTVWSNDVKNILFLSRIHPKKGIEFLINAISKIKTKGLKITIAGEGDPQYINSLKKLAQHNEVSHVFDFIGGVYGNQKWDLFNQADLFVLPTYSENFGIVVAEALATGIPVITTFGTPWQDLISRQCGWWIELSVENLTNCLIEALNTNGEQMKDMGMRGRRLVEDKYDIKTVAKNMYDFYLQINNNIEDVRN